MTYDTDHTISELIAVGREHHARERFGDARVDQWFRDNGINPDAVRGTEYRPSLPERSKSLGGPHGRKAQAERRAARWSHEDVAAPSTATPLPPPYPLIATVS